ncbi:MAG: hypothetical protein K2G37_00180 [Clostridia bacterium]|nr:hypothetical protein [Clostridia bacterium]MDE7328707.1 hypothetical protein [Clostridia bacterium]
MDGLRYTQKIKTDGKSILKHIILSLCVVALLVILVGIFACLGNKKYYDLIWYAVSLVVVILIQFSTVFLVYTVIIEYDNGILRVAKSYGGINVKVFDAKAKDLIVEKYSIGMMNGEKIIALVPKGCARVGYVVKLSGKNYSLNFDDYMYSLIEVARDIS